MTAPASSPTATHSSTSRRTLVAVLAVLAAIGAAVAMRDAILRGTDSEAYLAIADSIRDGDGLHMPFTMYTDRYSPAEAVAFDGRVPASNYPPGYPGAIAAVSALGLGSADAARLLHVLLTALVVAAWALLVRRLAPGAPLIAYAAGVGWIVVGPRGNNVLAQHVLVASEPLFVTCVLATLLVLDRAARNDRLAWWTATGVLAGAALLVRFPGVALLVPVAVVGMRTRRWRKSALAIVLGLTPTMVFLWWSRAAGAATRPLAWHPPDRLTRDMYELLAAWFTPRGWSAAVYVVVPAAIAAVTLGVRAAAWLTRQWAISTTFLVAYVVVVLAARTFVDDSTPIAERMFFPALMVVVALVVAASARLPEAARTPVFVLVAALAVGPGLPHTLRVVRDGVPSPPPPTPIALLAGVDPARPLFTNDPLGVYYDEGRSSVLLPSRRDLFVGRPNARYQEHLHEVVAIVCRDEAAVFMRGTSPRGVPDAAELQETGLHVVARDGDATLLGC